MSWLSKFFNKKEENEEEKQNGGHVSSEASSIASPFEGLDGIRFGRYSDNNKSYKKTKCWYEAEDLFKEKNYDRALEVLFEYLRDEEEDNVRLHKKGDSSYTFDIAQGSKIVHGEYDGQRLIARVPLAVMATSNTAVMRRLLELNYNLYYSRTAMDAYNLLYMLFDTDVATASPNKLYYGLRELATKADRQDDQLLLDFTSLKPAGTEQIQPIREHELDVKYKYTLKWTEDTLNRVDELNQDSFSGAIAYLLLTLIYRIDFLITPQAKFLTELEKASGLYWDKKDEIALVERNKMMKDAIRKFLDMSKQDFAESVYHVKDSFAISTPPKPDKVKEHIMNANKDSYWYMDNKYPDIGITLNEYGIMYNEFIYSMPRVMTDLTTIYMAILHADYFAELGMKTKLYNNETRTFEKLTIEKAVDEALNKFKDKYASMKWKHDRTEYDSLFNFGISFSEQMANLNLETKR